MLIGTSVHAVAEHITQLEIDGVNITEEIAFEILDKEWIISAFNSETEANQAMEKAREMLKTYLKWKSANPNKVVAAEQKFTIEIGEIPIKGSIDRIERTLEGDYEVIDFKTGSVKESKASIKDDIQMNVYALATEKLYGVLPKNTFLFYLKKNKIVVNKVESSHVGNIRKSLEDMVNSILREEFEATPSLKLAEIVIIKRYAIARKYDEDKLTSIIPPGNSYPYRTQMDNYITSAGLDNTQLCNINFFCWEGRRLERNLKKRNKCRY